MSIMNTQIVNRESPGYWKLSGPINENNEYHGECNCIYTDGSKDVFIGTWQNGWINGPGKYYI
jgi:hypothetical protein